jgi:hypothetical protein
VRDQGGRCETDKCAPEPSIDGPSPHAGETMIGGTFHSPQRPARRALGLFKPAGDRTKRLNSRGWYMGLGPKWAHQRPFKLAELILGSAEADQYHAVQIPHE